MQKDTYRRIKKFSENMEAMLRVYGMLELEDAYKIYCTLYDKNQDKTEFYRYGLCFIFHRRYSFTFRKPGK